MSSDLNTFLQRILGHVISNSSTLPTIMANKSNQESEDYLVQVMGDALIGLFDRPARSDSTAQNPLEHLKHAYQALAERNSLISAALGACECWGEQETCPSCQGNGHPGWAMPEPYLFKLLVLPANKAVKQMRLNPQHISYQPINPGNHV